MELETLLEKNNTRRRLENFAYRTVRDRQEAEDIAQDAIIRAHQSFRTYDQDRPFMNWMFRVTSNIIIDHRRRNTRSQRDFSLDAAIENDEDELLLQMPCKGDTPEQALVKKVFDEPLQRALAKVPPQMREKVLMAYCREMEYGEIAEQTNTSLGTIRSQIHRGMNYLRKELASSSYARQRPQLVP